jgi:hypothetical protein
MGRAWLIGILLVAVTSEDSDQGVVIPATQRKRATGRLRRVNVAIFGGLSRRPFPPGWTRETVVTIFGGGDLDLSASPSGPNPRLRAVAIFGGITIVVAPGTRVSVSGFGLLGGRDVKVSQSAGGPEIKMSLWAFLGGIDVKEPESKAA